jgi:hypothetical protein
VHSFCGQPPAIPRRKRPREALGRAEACRTRADRMQPAPTRRERVAGRLRTFNTGSRAWARRLACALLRRSRAAAGIRCQPAAPGRSGWPNGLHRDGRSAFPAGIALRATARPRRCGQAAAGKTTTVLIVFRQICRPRGAAFLSSVPQRSQRVESRRGRLWSRQRSGMIDQNVAPSGEKQAAFYWARRFGKPRRRVSM